MQELFIYIPAAFLAGYVANILVRRITREADKVRNQITTMCIELARQEGWFYNQHVERWENRYEPMCFTTAAMVQYVQENYLPGLKQLTA